MGGVAIMRRTISSRRSSSEVGLADTDEGSEFYDIMTTLVGMMTLTWAWAETGLAYMVEIIDSELWSPTKDHKELPVSLSRRLHFLRLAFADVEALSPLRERALALFQDFSTLKKEREALTHGATVQLHTDRFEISTISTKGRTNTHTKKIVTLKDAFALNTKITALAENGEVVLVDLCRAVGIMD